jgi:serine/threonine protein kinase
MYNNQAVISHKSLRPLSTQDRSKQLEVEQRRIQALRQVIDGRRSKDSKT